MLMYTFSAFFSESVYLLEKNYGKVYFQEELKK